MPTRKKTVLPWRVTVNDPPLQITARTEREAGVPASARLAHFDWAKKWLDAFEAPNDEGRRYRVFYDLAMPRHLELFPGVHRPTKDNTAMSFPFLTLFGEGKMERLVIAVEESTAPDREFIFLLAAGPLVSGHGGIMHGGFSGALVDELFGELLYFTRRGPAPHYPFEPSPLPNSFSGTPVGDIAPYEAPDIRIPHLTAYLHTDYKSPVLLPSPLVIRAKVAKEEGRKVFVRGRVCQYDETDAGWVERTCTENEVLFVLLKENAPGANGAKL